MIEQVESNTSKRHATMEIFADRPRRGPLRHFFRTQEVSAPINEMYFERRGSPYDNLPSQGFVEFQCSVISAWTAILKNELKKWN